MVPQELDILLRKAGSEKDQQSLADITSALNAALADLAASVGLHTLHGADGSMSVNLEGGLLSAILVVNKGKRLLTRCLKLLSDRQK